MLCGAAASLVWTQNGIFVGFIPMFGAISLADRAKVMPYTRARVVIV
jgi:hypothetical protein